MSRPLVYIAGPYRGVKEAAVFENIVRAREAAVQLWRMGFVPICPHLNSMLMGGSSSDETFLLGDLDILQRCDAVLLIAGWNESAGGLAERDFAAGVGIPLLVWERCRHENRMRCVAANSGKEVRPADVVIRWKGPS